MGWFVVYTKPRWEKKVAADLEKIGISAYCPTYTEVRQWSDRKKKVIVPLFRSFVFIKLNDKKREMVFEVPGVLRYLLWMQKPAVVREEEIEIIKKWLSNETLEGIEIGALSRGDEITISNGSFKGQKAVVAKLGKNRLRLILPSLNCVVNAKLHEVL